MESKMLAIRSSKETPKSNANLLPCRIHYDGKVTVSNQVWNPENVAVFNSTDSKSQETEETPVAYFRGRKLIGKAVKLPAGYHGAALCITESNLAQSNQQDSDEGNALNTHVAEQVADFDQFVIWRHESLPDATDDAYLKGMEEWMGLAELIHTP